MITKEDITQLIEQGLPGCQAIIKGDDGSHFEGIVISTEFADKNMLAQHRLVFATLGDRMQTGVIHALALRTYTPDQWASLNNNEQ